MKRLCEFDSFSLGLFLLLSDYEFIIEKVKPTPSANMVQPQTNSQTPSNCFLNSHRSNHSYKGDDNRTNTHIRCTSVTAWGRALVLNRVFVLQISHRSLRY